MRLTILFNNILLHYEVENFVTIISFLWWATLTKQTMFNMNIVDFAQLNKHFSNIKLVLPKLLSSVFIICYCIIYDIYEVAIHTNMVWHFSGCFQ